MTFHALVAHEDRVGFEELSDDDLPKHALTVDVAYSSVNYKDALAVTRRGRIVRRFPMVLGIDLAGTVTASEDPEFPVGTQIVGNGQGFGESEWGGYAKRARVKGESIVALPAGMTL